MDQRDMSERLFVRTGPIWKQVLALAWPVLLQQFLILCVELYDRYLAGQNVVADHAQHVAAQAAQTNAGYLAWFISNYSILVSAGSTALVARFVGARDSKLAHRALHQSILLAIVFGAAGGIAGLLGLPSIIRILGLEGAAAELAVAYLQPRLLLLMFQVLETVGIACLVGAGDTKIAPVTSGLVALVNIPLAWCLLHGFGPIPALGFRGIGFGTSISHVIGSSIVLAVLIRGRYGLRLHITQLVPDWHMMYRLLRVSVPAAVDSLSVILGQFWFLSLVNQVGGAQREYNIAAHGHAIIWEALGYLSGNAFGTAAMALVGQNLGARRPDAAAKSGWTALLLGGGFMCLMGTIFFCLAGPMFRLFSPYDHQRPIIEVGVPVLRLVAFAMPALASAIIFTYALRGAGDTRRPVLFTWTGFLLVRIPLAYLLTHEHLDLGPLGSIAGWDLGLFGAWLAMFADLYVRGTLFLVRFARGKWKATVV
jgi:putative MATE family efflux protein